MLATLSPIELCVLGSIVPITVSDRVVDDTPESQPVFLGIFNGKSMIFVLKMLLAPAYRWETMENIAGQCFVAQVIATARYNIILVAGAAGNSENPGKSIGLHCLDTTM